MLCNYIYAAIHVTFGVCQGLIGAGTAPLGVVVGKLRPTGEAVPRAAIPLFRIRAALSWSTASIAKARATWSTTGEREERSCSGDVQHLATAHFKTEAANSCVNYCTLAGSCDIILQVSTKGCWGSFFAQIESRQKPRCFPGFFVA